MNQTYTISGTYGRGTPCRVHCVSTWGGTWYACDGSVNVNLAPDVVLSPGVDVETLCDIDTFTASRPIEDPADIEEGLENV
jgi:hypothetical protein